LTYFGRGRTIKECSGRQNPAVSMGANQLRRRYGFDGCVPRTITLANQMETNLTADTQLALAA